MFFYSGSAVYNGKPLFDHKGDKGSQRKKPQNAPLCTFVTLRGKKNSRQKRESLYSFTLAYPHAIEKENGVDFMSVRSNPGALR